MLLSEIKEMKVFLKFYMPVGESDNRIFN